MPVEAVNKQPEPVCGCTHQLAKHDKHDADLGRARCQSGAMPELPFHQSDFTRQDSGKYR